MSIVLLTLLAYPVRISAQAGSPFAPPRASIHYAPDRTCDLINVSAEIDVDYPNRSIKGHAVNTLAPLREGLREIDLMARDPMKISRITLDGVPIKFSRTGDQLELFTQPLTKGKAVAVAIDYVVAGAKGRGFGAGAGGWHWIEPRKGVANREGFWTQGETGYNSQWVPTWDYPNDFTTSEIRTTVQADWQVVGNGLLISNTLSADGKRRTYDWKMTQPHATYLLTICGGPFDIKRDTWEGVQLWYVVPKGQGQYIDSTFGHTKDMLSFYSSRVGYKYAWPKYAQDAMFDFGGGMENVSATTLGEGALVEARDGYFEADSVNSHELGHQWFGDLVTCEHWGDIWLNESFATFMQMLYFEHSRTKTAYDWEVANNTQAYLAEARRYKRPISTHLYPNPDAMFDSHTYPKGGMVLHTLRRQMGDEAFFSGLKSYLTTYAHTPVEWPQLVRALTFSSGINVQPFFDQWILKPGHPVLDSTWTYDGKSVSVHVKQLQDTSNGTPIYDIPAKVGLIYSTAGKVVRMPVHLTSADQTFELPAGSKPDAVLLDPDHDFLREIPNLHWSAGELQAIVANAPFGPDRQTAMAMMLRDNPGQDAINTAVTAIKRDNSAFPAFRSILPLSDLKNSALRPLFTELLDSPNFQRRAQAVSSLAALPQDTDTTRRLRALINERSPTQVVVNAIHALDNWDAKGNLAVFQAAQKIADRRHRIHTAAELAISDAK